MPVKSQVVALAEKLRTGVLAFRPELEAALEARRFDHAEALLLAAAANGDSLVPADVARVAPNAPGTLLLPLLAPRTTDPLEAVRAALDADQMSDERDAASLFAASLLVEGSPPPGWLIDHLRRRAERYLSPQATVVFQAAAQILGDELALRLKGLGTCPQAGVENLREAFGKLMRGGVLEALDMMPADRPTQVTVQRDAPKVGRNDPCPCGSGLKHKKCCGSAPRAHDPDAERQTMLARAAPRLSADQVRDMRIQELTLLDLKELKTIPLITAMRQFLAFRRWEDAERALAVMDGRKDLPGTGTADDYRWELLKDALQEGRLDVAERTEAVISDPELFSDSMELELELLRRKDLPASELEKFARGMVEGGAELEITETAHVLLRRFPALGILVARGCLHPDRYLDAGVLVEVIEEARIKLGIPSEDRPARMLLELLEADVEGEDPPPTHASTGEKRALQEKTKRLERELRAAGERAESLRKQLADAEQAVRTVEPAKPSQLPADPEEVRRLRSKVDALKGLIAEGNRERSGLREALEAVKAGPRPSAASGSKMAARPVEDDGLEGALGEDEAMVRGIVVPVFEPGAKDALSGLPRRIAQEVLVRTAEIASGQRAAWREVKKLKGFSDLLAARVGIHYRVLFRMEPGALVVEALVAREGLDGVLRNRRKM